jgi:6-phosphogluconolactonase
VDEPRVLALRDDDVIVLADEEAVAREAARRLVAGVNQAIRERGEAHVALTGGSSAVALYRELVRHEWRGAADWSVVHLWWGDERLVPVDHPDSNAGLAYNLLLAFAARAGESGAGGAGTDVSAGEIAALPVQVENVHPYPVDESLSESDPGLLVADTYRVELGRYLPAVGDLPGFDVILLGVGPDGHILSIFPRSRALRSSELVVAVSAPEHIEPHVPRVSLNPKLLAVAGVVIVTVVGANKAEVMADVLGPKRDPSRWPAQLARRTNAIWLLDEAAAARLR